MDLFDEEQLQEFRNIFSLFDKDGDGTVNTSELGTVLRSLGQNPSPEELKKIIEEIDTDGSGEIEFDEFMTMMTNCLNENRVEKDLCDAFQELAKGNEGVIDVESLRDALSRLGEPLSQEEIDDMILTADPLGEGTVEIHGFVQRLINPA